MKIEENKVYLTFDNAKNGLYSSGKELSYFSIAGADKKFTPAKAVITEEGITLIAEGVTEPVAIRYAFINYAKGDLFNTAGLPASSFRTDDWEE